MNMKITKIYLRSFIFLVLLSSIFSINYSGHKLANLEIIRNYETPTCSSEYWEVSFIHINNNWSETALTYEWCNYENGYYIIENVSISGVFGRNGIYIENTNESFIIRNCQIDKGISVLKVSNGHIINNNISHGQAYYTGTTLKIGIYMARCLNSTIGYNFFNGTFGYYSSSVIMTYRCNNIIINGNTISKNEYTGLRSSYGLDIQGSSEKITVSNNTILDREFGMSFDHCNYSSITGNYITYRNSCIKEFDCYGNIFTNNICRKITEPEPAFDYYPWIVLGISISIIGALIVVARAKKR